MEAAAGTGVNAAPRPPDDTRDKKLRHARQSAAIDGCRAALSPLDELAQALL